MGLVLRPYELTLWFDQWQSSSSTFAEQRFAVIGSDKLTDACRAQNVKLTRNVNGKVSLTFDMYYRYIDTITGEETDNPYTSYMVNETKLRLHYEDNWYDFIIRNVDKDSANKKYSYTAEDANVLELSKNGFNVELNTDLNNNQGTALQLATTILDGSGWGVESEPIVQRVNEALVRLTVSTAFTAYQILDSNLSTGISITTTGTVIPVDAHIYGFYSCCKEQSYRFQFIYRDDDTYTVDDERVVTDKNSQWVVDNMTYTSNASATAFGIYVPANTALWPDADTQDVVDAEKRGKRYGFVQLREYDKVLDKYVYKCTYNGATNNTANYYIETAYTSPNLIENYISNPNTFKSSSGWTGAYSTLNSSYYNKSSTYQTTCEVDSYSPTTGHNCVYDILESHLSSLPSDYISFLNVGFKDCSQATDTYGLFVNSSFYDQRSKLTNGLITGEKYALYFKVSAGTTLPAYTLKVAKWNYDTDHSCYTVNPATADAYLTFDMSTATAYGDTGYYYVIATVNNYDNMTAKVCQNSKIKSFIYRNSDSGSATISIYDMQIFCYKPISDSDAKPTLPSDQPINATVVNTYYYYDPATNASATSEEDYVYLHKGDQLPVASYPPKFDAQAQAIRSIEVKETNYWNAIQTLCEKFECWAEVVVTRDSAGTVLSRKIKLRNYIGQDNYVGFKYGVNLTSIKRNVKSDSFTTKLIVKSNNNENAENGVCTIATAPSNETGESYIWNFNYYFNKGMLGATAYLNNIDAVTANSTGEDMTLWGESSSATYTCQGYLPRIRKLNAQIEKDTLAVESLLISVTYANADVETYQAAKDAAEDSLTSAAIGFENEFGYGWDEINDSSISTTERTKRQEQCNNDHVKSLIQELAQYKTAYDLNTTKLASATTAQTTYTTEYNTALSNLNTHSQWKAKLNKAFYLVYHRFIQEGTWTSSEYISDEEYYIDAQSVSYESALPQVSYTLSVAAYDALDGYDILKYDLGDQTYIEDIEFFGKNSSGAPYREEVAVTEITRSLDDPTQDSIKIQNYSNQFEDLFHAMTATVQSTQYSKSAYQRAASLALASDKEKVKYLQGALTDMSTVLTNAGEQSVVWDSTGITITNKAEPSKQMRLNSSGLLLRQQDESGTEQWVLGMSADGIAAETITSGALNTGKIQILNGDEPYFLWDSFGLTAYEFGVATSTGAQHGKNTTKGVRFDRFGIYGFSGIDASTWHPEDIIRHSSTSSETSVVRDYSIFELTKYGLYLDLSASTLTKAYNSAGTLNWLSSPITHRGAVYLGNADSCIYDTWHETSVSSGQLVIGTPYYNGDGTQFTKVMSVISGTGTTAKEQFALYDDGTLIAQKAIVSGTIYATSGQFSGTVYASAGEFTGTITASAGNFGGWTITANGIQNAESAPSCWINSTAITQVASVDLPIVNSAPLVATANSATVIVQFGPNFKVYSDGTVEVTGSITANALYIYDSDANTIFQASGSGTNPVVKMGGWQADANKLYKSDDSTNWYLNSSGNGSVKFGNNFSIDTSGNVTITGTVYASAGSFTGTVYASQGTIGGWTLASDGLYNAGTKASATIGLSMDSTTAGTYAFWSGGAYSGTPTFSVTNSGILHSTLGMIGGWTISSEGLYNNSTTSEATFWLKPSVTGSDIAVQFGNNFKIDASGNVTASGNITASGITVKNASDYVVFQATGNGTTNPTVTMAGWIAGGSTLQNSAGTVGMASSTGNSTVFWAGSSTISSAPFRVTANGDVTLNSATIGPITVGTVDSRTALILTSATDDTAQFYVGSTTDTHTTLTAEGIAVHQGPRQIFLGVHSYPGLVYAGTNGVCYITTLGNDAKVNRLDIWEWASVRINSATTITAQLTCTNLGVTTIHDAAPTSSTSGSTGDIWIYTD